MKKRIFIVAISIISIILFLYAAINKLADYDLFKDEIAVSPILKPFAGVIAWLLPLAELIIAGSLLIPKWRLLGLYAAFGLMIMFSIYVVMLFTVNEKTHCSCGGIIDLLSLKQHLMLNLVLALLQAIGIKFQKQTVQTHRISY